MDEIPDIIATDRCRSDAQCHNKIAKSLQWLPIYRTQSVHLTMAKIKVGSSDLGIIIRFSTQTLLNGYNDYRAISVNPPPPLPPPHPNHPHPNQH